MSAAGLAASCDSRSQGPVLSGMVASEANAISGRILDAILRAELPNGTKNDLGIAVRRRVGLGEGLAGMALVRACAGEGQEDAGEALTLAVKALHRASRFADTSLFGGLAGAAWVVAHVARRVGDDVEPVLAPVDSRLLRLVSRSPWRGSFDLISGLAGLGVYALERLPAPAGRAILRAVVARLAEVAELREGGATWRTTPRLLPKERRAEFPEGHYNLGVAHGTPGVVGLLGRVVAAGVEAGRAGDLLERAVRWLRGQASQEGAVRYAKWIGPGLPLVHRQAWCYGDPGVACALLLAARATGNAAWEGEAIATAHSAAGCPRDASGVVSPDLCHGAAGLGHIFGRFFRATGDERFRAAAERWFREAMAMLEREWPGDAAFLQGAAGAALALRSAATATEAGWDRALLVSGDERMG